MSVHPTRFTQYPKNIFSLTFVKVSKKWYSAFDGPYDTILSFFALRNKLTHDLVYGPVLLKLKCKGPK